MANQDPRKQHLVSKVLLKQFATDRGELASLDLRFGKVSRKHPSQVAWQMDFVAEQRRELESLWGASESTAQSAIDLAVAGTVFGDSEAVAVLKDLIALHFMRNTRVKALWQIGFSNAIRTVNAPAHFPGNSEVLKAVLRHRLRESAPTWFAEQQRESLEQAKQRVARSGLEVIRAGDAPVLIGDRSVVSAIQGADGYVFEYAPFADATTHVLPIGPRHLIALGRENKYLDPDAKWIDLLNRHQIYQAHSHVFFSPFDSDLETRVQQIRDEANRDSGLGG